ncbi:hypothetical protein QQ045_031183 [Rhodiola kirilowii]
MSIEDPAGFWSDIASEFYWKQKWGEVVCSENFDVRKGTISIEWFKGGVTNICYNCLDRNIDKVAMYWEGNEPDFDDKLTYSQLLDKVCQFCAWSENRAVVRFELRDLIYKYDYKEKEQRGRRAFVRLVYQMPNGAEVGVSELPTVLICQILSGY